MKSVKNHISTFASTILIILSCSLLNAQVFVELTGSDNPFHGINLEYYSAPGLVDIDGDGDLDAFLGQESGRIFYFENVGDRLNASYTQRSGSDNPMYGYDAGYDAVPSFVDIDSDGDFDLFIGNWDGEYLYFENTGSKETPFFEQHIGSSNPMDIFDVGRASVPRFIDFDNDGDWDVVSGAQNGKFQCFENTGTATEAVYTFLNGSSCPLNGIDLGKYSSPAFIDIDADGDYDIIAGKENGKFTYIKNTGTMDEPNYVVQDASINPMQGEDIGLYSMPIAADLNFDSSADLIIGAGNGNYHFYMGSGGGSPLPIDLVSFEAEPTNNKQVKLNWITAAEINNSFFTVERSKDGVSFENVINVDGAGNSNSSMAYHAYDETPFSGQSYYRLKQTDHNGEYTYSDVISVLIEVTEDAEMTIYPNPSDQNQIYAKINGSNEGSVLMIKLIDVQGRVVFKKYIGLNGITAKIDLDPSLPKGIYHVVTTIGNQRLQQKFIRN